MKIEARRTIRTLISVGLTAVLSGCAGYQLGSTIPPDIKTVFIRTFVNATGEPQLEVPTTNATIQEFQKDGTLTVTGEGDADLVVEAKLVGYELEPVSYRRDRPAQTQDYRVRIVADATATRASTGKVLAEMKGVEGEATFKISGDLKTDERNALPKAARDLAHRIVKNVVEQW